MEYLSTTDGETTIDEMVAARQELATLSADVRDFRELIERLHLQNEELHRATLERVLEPILRDLIKVAEDYRRLRIASEHKASEGAPAVGAVCAGVTQDVEALLDRYGVEQICPEPGVRFDRREYRAVQTVPTSEPEADETVECTRDPGYRVGPKILRYPNVVVRKYTPAAMLVPSAGSSDQQGQENDGDDDGAE
jgi:molecular chaperone GrpE (heat shock protein)